MVHSPPGKLSFLAGDEVGESLHTLVAGLEQLRNLAESLVEHHEQGQQSPAKVQLHYERKAPVSPEIKLHIEDGISTSPYASQGKQHLLSGPLPLPKAMVTDSSSGTDGYVNFSAVDEDEPCWPEKASLERKVSFAMAEDEETMQGSMSLLSNGQTTSPDKKPRARTVAFDTDLRCSAQAQDRCCEEVIDKEDIRKLSVQSGRQSIGSAMCTGSPSKPALSARASSQSGTESQHYVEEQVVQTTLREVWTDALKTREKSAQFTRSFQKGQLTEQVAFMVEVLDSPERKLLSPSSARKRAASTRIKKVSLVKKVTTIKRHTVKTTHHHNESQMVMWCNFCILHPFGWFVTLWCCLSVFIVFFDLLAIPMEVFPLPESARLRMHHFNAISGVFWAVDIILNFRTAIVMGTAVEYRPGSIAAHYCKTWFPLDLFLVCCEWIGVLLQSRSIQFIIKFLKIPKLLRLAKLPHLCKMLEEKFIHSPAMQLFVLMVKMTIALCFSVHLTTCGWYGIGSAYPDGWITYFAIPPCGMLSTEQSSEIDSDGEITFDRTMTLYFSSCRWVLAQVNGRTDQDARRNIVEMLYTCVCAVVGPLLAMSVFVSCITSTMMELSAMASENRNRRQLVDQYADLHRIHPELKALLKQHLRYKDDLSKHTELEMQLLDLLPMQLRKDLLYEVRSPVLAAHPLFHFLNLHFASSIRDICILTLVHMVVKQGEKIFEKGDACTRMLFLYRGSFMYSQAKSSSKRKPGMVLQNGEDSDASNSEATRFSKMSKHPHVSSGVWISEAAIWIEWQNLGQLHAHSDGCLYSIDAHSFAGALRIYGAIFTMVARYGRAFNEALQDHGHLSDVLDITVSDEVGSEADLPVTTFGSQVRAWRSMYAG